MPYKDPEKQKAFHESPRQKAYQKEYYQKNRKKIIARVMERERFLLKTDPEFVKLKNKRSRDHYYKNRKKRQKQIAEWKKKEYKKDPVFRMRMCIKSGLRSSLKRRGYTKKSRTHEVLGCSFDFFVSFMEKKFQNGMNWENYGKWELDHIVPVSLGKTEEEIVALNNYINFQPLWKEDNIKKYDKIVWEMIPAENREKYKNLIKRKR